MRRRHSRNCQPIKNGNLRYLGYYFTDSDRYGDFTGEVSLYTNLYVAIPDGYETSNPDWQTRLHNSMQTAVNNGNAIYLQLWDKTVTPSFVVTVDSILDVAAPFWDHVVYAEVAHERTMSGGEVQGLVDWVKWRMAVHGLQERPCGVLLSFDQVQYTSAVDAANLSFVGIEAYVPGPGNPDSNANVSTLNNNLAAAKNRVRAAGKSAVLVMQGYDINGSWTNISNLSALQAPVYLNAYADPVVSAIIVFNYGRPGGTRTHAAYLQQIHRDIWAAMAGSSGPGRYKSDGNGGCYWDPYDSGPNQCTPILGRWKSDGQGGCYWDPYDSGPNQCLPPMAEERAPWFANLGERIWLRH